MENKPKFHPNPQLKLIDQVREVLRYQHYSYRTEQTYCQWILRHLRHFGGKTHPRLLGAKNIEAFLSSLATAQARWLPQRNDRPLMPLFSGINMSWIGVWRKTARRCAARPPTVMTQFEVQRVLAAMEGKPALMAKLLYGGGLRLMECIRYPLSRGQASRE